jgi:hypothetical protein
MPDRAAILAALTAATLIVGGSARAATKHEIMQSRYMQYQFCMERGLNWKLGAQKGWLEGHNLEARMNQWGTTEPTQAAIESASPALRKLDAECRRKNDIANEPRPR